MKYVVERNQRKFHHLLTTMLSMSEAKALLAKAAKEREILRQIKRAKA